jgi:predicted acyltransferase
VLSNVSSNKEIQKNNRLHSLDALRGVDMFHGIAAVIQQKHSLVQNKTSWQIEMPESLSWIEKIFITISNQLHHSVWNGFTFYDLIFPLFIFIAGVSMSFSLSKQIDQSGENRSSIRKKIIISLAKRTILLLLLGLVVNGALQFKGYEQTRFVSVLGRIGLSCFFAGLIFLYCNPIKQLIWLIAILIGYWLMLILIPVPGYGAGVLTPDGNLAAYIDRQLLPGKLHREVYDPEGLFSTLPAIASALIGLLAGQFIMATTQKSIVNKAAMLMLGGLFLLITGFAWGYIFPINKILWSSSYVLFAGGCSLILFSIFYYFLDAPGSKKRSGIFTWMGMNAILIYVAAHGLINFESTAAFVFGGLINFLPAIWHSALLWIGVAIIQFGGLYFLYKRNLFLKL